jgi:hypothetical protein
MKLLLWIDTRQTIKTAYNDLEAYINFLIYDIQPSKHVNYTDGGPKAFSWRSF